MTKALRTLYLLWLPIAFFGLVLPSKGQSNAGHIYVRDALDEQIAALKAEHGENVDTTLDGYDHELVAAVLKQGQQKRSATILARDQIAREAPAVKAELGNTVDMSLEGYDLTGLDENEDTIAKRSIILAREDIAKGAAAVRSELGSKVDTSLDGYDLTDLDDDDDASDNTATKTSTILARGLPGSTEGTFFGDVLARLENYGTGHEHDEDDSTITRRDTINVETPDNDDFPAGVDFSLDGYDDDDDSATLTRRDDVEIPNIADFPEADVDYSLTSYDTSTLTRRDELADVENPDKADFDDEDNVDFALERYDTSTLTRRDDLADVESPDKADFDEDVDFSLKGYDTSILARRNDLADVESPDKEDFPADLDFSLEGYDTSTLVRRNTGEEDEEGTFDKLFPESHYLQPWDDEVQKRDFPDSDDEVVEDADTSNDRYQDTTKESEADASESLSPQATAAAEAARRKIRRTVDSAEEEVGGLYKKLKALLRRPQRHG